MAASHVAAPNITSSWSLTEFVSEAWLYQLADRDLPGSSTSSDVMINNLCTGELDRKRARDARNFLLRGEGDDLTPRKREELRWYFQQLDERVARNQPDRRSHLAQYFANSNAQAAPVRESEPIRFFGAWAAGPTRSKFEVLERGALAASYTSQLGDELERFLSTQARPRSPYAERSVETLLRATCRELLNVMCLPRSSGSHTAARYLAVIGEIALEEMSKLLLGSEDAPFGSPLHWRSPLVITRICEISSHRETAERTWGRLRAPRVLDQAATLLLALSSSPLPNINRSRSLIAEATRRLPEHRHRPLLHDALRQQVREGLFSGPDGKVELLGERGFLWPRHVGNSALVIFAEDPLAAQRALARTDTSTRTFHRQALRPSKKYIATDLSYRSGNGPGSCPPLDAFMPGEIAAQIVRQFEDQGSTKGINTGIPADRYREAQRVLEWDSVARTHKALKPVRAARDCVWSALRSPLDDGFDSDGAYVHARWRRAREAKRAAATSPATTALDGVGPFHLREAVRSVVAQACLTIDGTARRDAIRALAEADLSDIAADLFACVIRQCREAEDPNGHLDWVLEQATFCAGHCGSTKAVPILMEQAGLVGENPDDYVEARRWIRVTALFGLADLGDQLHDAEGEDAAVIDDLLAAISERLIQIAGSNTVRTMDRWGLRPEDLARFDLHTVQLSVSAGEWRALAYCLAMLRSENEISVSLLHLLSGRAVVPNEKSEAAGWARFRKPIAVSADLSDPKPRSRPVSSWSKFLNEHKAILNTPAYWDLTTWQIAEWGASRIETRFSNQGYETGVRLSDASASSLDAEARMRTVCVDGAPPRLPKLEPR